MAVHARMCADAGEGAGTPLDRPEPRQHIRSGIIQIALAWLLGRFVVTALSPVGVLSFWPGDWYHWDAFNYLSISAAGRTFGICGTPGFPKGFLPVHWCGTAGWLPGFSYAIKLTSAFGIDSARASVIIPALFTLGILAVAWLGWTRHVTQWQSIAVLALIAVFPGAIYNYAPFPTSLALLGIIAAALAAAKNRPGWAALAIAVAVVSYSTAVFAAIGLVAAMVLSTWDQGWRAKVERAAWGLAGFASLAALAIHDQLVLHHWNAYSLIQNQTTKTFDLPGVQTFQLIVDRTTRTQRFIGPTGAWLMSVQAVLAIALIVAGCVLGFRWWWRNGRSTLDLYPAAIGATTLLFVLSSGTGSVWHRGVVLAAPSALAFRRLPAWAIALLAVLAGTVTAFLSSYYFKNTLG